MGAVGKGNTSTMESTTTKRDNIKDLAERYSYKDGETYKEMEDRLRKDFNIPGATVAQLNTIRDIFRSVANYDHQYNADKTPFEVEDLVIQRVQEYTPEELQHNKELFGRTMENKDIQFRMTTKPNSGNSYLDMLDEKYRYTLIGKNGGLYTYNNKGKRVAVDRIKFMISGTRY